jgi:hypothetical protein
VWANPLLLCRIPTQTIRKRGIVHRNVLLNLPLLADAKMRRCATRRIVEGGKHSIQRSRRDVQDDRSDLLATPPSLKIIGGDRTLDCERTPIDCHVVLLKEI